MWTFNFDQIGRQRDSLIITSTGTSCSKSCGVCVCVTEICFPRSRIAAALILKMKVREGNEKTQKKTAKIISLNEKGVFEMEYASLAG